MVENNSNAYISSSPPISMKRKAIIYKLGSNDSYSALVTHLEDQGIDVRRMGTAHPSHLIDQESNPSGQRLGLAFNLESHNRYVEAKIDSRLISILDAYEPVEARES